MNGAMNSMPELEQVKVEQQASRQVESKTHSTALSKSLPGGHSQLERLYSAVVEEKTKPLGFFFDQERSTEFRPVYAKPIADAWRLCITPEPLAWYPGSGEGDVLLLLSLQNYAVTDYLRSTKFDLFLLIEYSEFIYHFDLVYRSFQTLEDLETVILARLKLLTFVLEKIEPILVSVLKRR